MGASSLLCNVLTGYLLYGEVQLGCWIQRLKLEDWKSSVVATRRRRLFVAVPDFGRATKPSTKLHVYGISDQPYPMGSTQDLKMIAGKAQVLDEPWVKFSIGAQHHVFVRNGLLVPPVAM